MGNFWQVFRILLAEDNDSDIALFRRAIARIGDTNRVEVVTDGEEAIAYLQGTGHFQDRERFPFPDFLVLDLKMPRKTGFDVLDWLRTHPRCFVIPTVVFTASEMESDIEQTYHLGANTYFTKPEDFHKLVELLRIILIYWKEAKRPKHPPAGRCS